MTITNHLNPKSPLKTIPQLLQGQPTGLNQKAAMKSLSIYLHNTTGLSLSDPIKKKLKEKILTKNNQRDVIVVPEAKCTNSVWIGATSGDSKFYFSGYDAHMIENGMRVIQLPITKDKVSVVSALTTDIFYLEIQEYLTCYDHGQF